MSKPMLVFLTFVLTISNLLLVLLLVLVSVERFEQPVTDMLARLRRTDDRITAASREAQTQLIAELARQLGQRTPGK